MLILAMKSLAFWDIQVVLSTFLLLQADIRDKDGLEQVFASARFDVVIHFAGLKAVGECVQKPLLCLYYDHNVVGTISLLEIMSAHGCKKVFTIFLGYLVLHVIF